MESGPILRHQTETRPWFLEEYFSSSKTFGSLPPEQLRAVSHFLLYDARYHDSWAHHQGERYYRERVAASALIEAILQEGNGQLDTVDHQLKDLQYVDDLYTEMKLDEFEYLSSTQWNELEFKPLMQIEFYQSFMNVYRDIVCGEVTLQTKEELLQDLQGLSEAIADILSRSIYYRSAEDIEKLKELAGAKGEIDAAFLLWSTYTKEGDPVYFPASMRGDSGLFHRETTHDLSVAIQTDPTTITSPWQYQEGIEVKYHPTSDQKERLQRYELPIFSVNSLRYHIEGTLLDRTLNELAS